MLTGWRSGWRIGWWAKRVFEAALTLAERLARGPAFANAMTKRMIEDEAHLGLDDAIEAEAQAQAICMAHSDFREAHDARVEKRDPSFKVFGE